MGAKKQFPTRKSLKDVCLPYYLYLLLWLNAFSFPLRFYFFQYFLAVISLISDTLAASVQEKNATNLVDKILIFPVLIVNF